jgi:hypothetical protein
MTAHQNLSQVTFLSLIRSSKVLQRFNATPTVAVVDNNSVILTDLLPLVHTHKVCYQLIKHKFIKGFKVLQDKNILVVYI